MSTDTIKNWIECNRPSSADLATVDFAKIDRYLDGCAELSSLAELSSRPEDHPEYEALVDVSDHQWQDLSLPEMWVINERRYRELLDGES